MTKKKVSEKEMLTAVTKMLNAYEKLIEDPKGNIEKWENYGSAYACFLCGLFVEHECVHCPLQGMSKEPLDCATDTMDALIDVVRSSSFVLSSSSSYSEIKKAARARYNELVQHLETKGIYYE